MQWICEAAFGRAAHGTRCTELCHCFPSLHADDACTGLTRSGQPLRAVVLCQPRAGPAGCNHDYAGMQLGHRLRRKKATSAKPETRGVCLQRAQLDAIMILQIVGGSDIFCSLTGSTQHHPDLVPHHGCTGTLCSTSESIGKANNGVLRATSVRIVLLCGALVRASKYCVFRIEVLVHRCASQHLSHLPPKAQHSSLRVIRQACRNSVSRQCQTISSYQVPCYGAVADISATMLHIPHSQQFAGLVG